MKFVALALALLMAVGSHAAALQADSPSQLEHAKAAMNQFLINLDDTEFKDLKTKLSSHIDIIVNKIQSLQAQSAPVTDGVYTTISEATTDLRQSINAEIEGLKTELKSEGEVVTEVVKKHMTEYYDLLLPIVNEYNIKYTEEINALKDKMQPVWEEMQNKVATNVAETKDAMMPIVAGVSTKLFDNLKQLMVMAAPYIEEHKEHIVQSYSQAQMNPEQINALRMKLIPLANEMKEKLAAIFLNPADSATS